MIVLQLKNERLGSVWRQTQWQRKRRTSQLVMPIPRVGAREEGGLVVVGVANQREGRVIVKGDVVKNGGEGSLGHGGQRQRGLCQIPLFRGPLAQTLRPPQDVPQTAHEDHLGDPQLNPELGIKIAAEARTCQGQGLPKVVGGLTRGGDSCRVWPKKEEDMVARAAARRYLQIIMVTNRETGIAAVRRRGADSMAGRSSKEARNVYGAAGRTELEQRRAEPGAREKE